MTQRRKLSFVVLLLGAMTLGAVVGSGCAIHRGDRSIVQPLALDKKQFQGNWYFQKTIVDAPYDAPGVFPGNQSEGYKIRWEIGERYLYAFTTQPNVRNANSTVAPVAAWPIQGHFTVRYMINYTNGQPSNIVGEDWRDKPWYERPHFRVSWGGSAIQDFSTWDWIYQLFGMFNAFTERASNVRPEQVRILPNYMDFVCEEILTPGPGPIISKFMADYPITSYRIKWRYSFLKVPEKSTYTPKPMSDDQFQKFGYFRTAILQYHVDRGLVDWSYQYLANRHNVATKAELDKYEQAKTPEADRKPKQIVYHLSPDFPADMLPTAYEIIKEWNKAFQRATQRTDDVIVLRANDDGLPKGQKREMGDLRYRFLYWVPQAISFGLLGYGPSFADYDTGEIISSAAYVYGATVKLVSNRFLLLYDMVNGTYTDEDLRNGKDYLDIINNFTGDTTTNKPLTMVENHGIMAPKYQGFDMKNALEFIKTPTFELRNRQMRQVSRSAIQARLALVDSRPDLKWAMIPDEYFQDLFPGVNIAQLRKLDTQNSDAILNDYVNPSNLMRINSLRKLLKEGDQFGENNMMLASYVDPALTKFIQANKNKPRPELKTLMDRMIFLGTEAHEIGHTLGLRHNFEGSADEPNYFPEYFEIKDRQTGNIPGTDEDPRHRWFYMYSSIMDYHGETYGDAVGIGSYDHAAIIYAYGSLLELDPRDGTASLAGVEAYLTKVAEKAKSSTGYKGIFDRVEVKQNKLQTFTAKGFDGKDIGMFDTNQVLLLIEGIKGDKRTDIMRLTADDLSGQQALRDIHSHYGIAPPNARFYTDGTPSIQPLAVPLKRRFYRFCSDELVGQSPYCARFDSGSNPKEMIDNMIRRYDGSYPLRNWNRGRRFYRLNSGYVYGLINNFSLISLFFQNWMYRLIYEEGFEGSKEYFDQLAAVQRGVAFTSRVIYTPEPGRHVHDASTNAYITSAKAAQDILNVPVGVGRYFYSKLQDDDLGLAMYRFQRIGTMYDKYVALMVLAERDWGLNNQGINFFYVNFADYFSKDDVTDLFTAAISGIFDPKYAFTYKDKMINPNFHPVLQYTSMYMAVSMLNSGFFGNTFTHYMTVGIKGGGDDWTPPPGRENQTISFSNTEGTRTYFAVQTQDGRSISYKLVKRGKDLADKIKELRALPTSAVNQAELQEKESQLVFMETVLQMLRLYVNIFFDG